MITPVDFAFVSAKLHGMRSKLYEGTRLEALTSLRNAFEMMASVFPALDVRSRIRFEQRLVEAHVADLHRVLVFLDGANREFFEWQLERYRVENLKVVLRGWKERRTPGELAELVVTLPAEYSLPVEKLLSAGQLADFVRVAPLSHLKEGIRRGTLHFHDTNKLFYIEAGLDAVYFEELCRRAGKLDRPDRDEVSGLLHFEVLVYDVLFAMRARLNYNLAPQDVQDFLPVGWQSLAGTSLFESMLRAGTFEQMVRLMPNRRLLIGRDEPPVDLGELQKRMWDRLYQQANRLFYSSMFHMGCVEGFYYIKRVELNNLIRVAELLRQEVPGAGIRAQLIAVPSEGR